MKKEYFGFIVWNTGNLTVVESHTKETWDFMIHAGYDDLDSPLIGEYYLAASKKEAEKIRSLITSLKRR